MSPLSQYQRLPEVRSRISVARWFVYLLLVGIGLLALAALGLTSYLRLSSDTATLRDAAQACSHGQWRRLVAFSIGDRTFLLARMGLFFANIPEEPRTALSAIRGCEVGVYECGDLDSTDRAAILPRADKEMSRRGWERIVGVMDKEDLVAMYVPLKMSSPKSVKACVLVFDGRQVVVVSAKGNLEPVIELALKKANLHRQLASLAEF